VGRDDPERGEQRAQRDHARGEEVHLVRYALPAEQHHAQERGFEEERGQHLVAQQRPEDVARALAEYRPVGAELEAHHDARHHAHAERDREDLEPEEVEVPPQRLARAQPAPFEEGQPMRQADGERREQDVERNHERELHAREEQRRQQEVIHLARLRGVGGSPPRVLCARGRGLRKKDAFAGRVRSPAKTASASRTAPTGHPVLPLARRQVRNPRPRSCAIATHDPWPMRRARRLLRFAGFSTRKPMMRLLACLALLPLAGAFAATVHAQPVQPLTLEQVMADPDWIGSGVDRAWWSWDGTHAYYLRKRDGSDIRDTYSQAVEGG